MIDDGADIGDSGNPADDPSDAGGDDAGDPSDTGDDGTDGGSPPTSSGKYVLFDDPDSDFSTTDVNDVDGEIVRFHTQTQAIIWAADDTSYQEGLWSAEGNQLAGGGFTVRFGTKDGQRKAYFTETNPPNICDLYIVQELLVIAPTSETVPQE